MAIVGVVSSFSTLQFLQTLIVEKDENRAIVLLNLCRIINLSLAAFSFILIAVFHNYIVSYIGNQGISFWLFLLPVSFYLTGHNQIFSTWANRMKEYDLLKYNGIVLALTVPMISIPLGVFIKSEIGLFLGLLSGQIVSALYLYLKLTNRYLGLKYKYEPAKFLFLFRVYNDFPKYNLPSDFVYRLISQLPVFMINTYIGTAFVGIYNLTVRLISVPSLFLSNAIGQVYRQKLAELYSAKDKGKLNDLFKYTSIQLGLISLPLIISMTLFGPEIFVLIFGDEWRESGVLSKYLVLFFGFQMIVSPLTFIYFVRKKLKENFLAHIYILVSNYLVFLVGFRYGYDVYNVILIFSINYCLFYSYYFLRSYMLTTSISND